MDNLPALDPRITSFVVLDETGPRPLAYQDLVQHTGTWSTTSPTPPGVAELLKTTRDIYSLAVYHYELFAVASLWSLLAVEASLRVHYDDDRASLKALIARAQRDSLLTAEWAARLDAGRELRNSFLHGRQQPVWTPGMAAGIIRATHAAVAHLFPQDT